MNKVSKAKKIEIYKKCLTMLEHKPLVLPLSGYVLTYKIAENDSPFRQTSMYILPITGNSTYLKSMLVNVFGIKEVKHMIYTNERITPIVFTGEQKDAIEKDLENEY